MLSGEHIFDACITIALFIMAFLQRQHIADKRDMKEKIEALESRQSKRMDDVEERQTRMESNYIKEFKAVRDDIKELQITLLKEISSIRINCALVNHVRTIGNPEA